MGRQGNLDEATTRCSCDPHASPREVTRDVRIRPSGAAKNAAQLSGQLVLPQLCNPVHAQMWHAAFPQKPFVDKFRDASTATC